MGDKVLVFSTEFNWVGSWKGNTIVVTYQIDIGHYWQGGVQWLWRIKFTRDTARAFWDILLDKFSSAPFEFWAFCQSAIGQWPASEVWGIDNLKSTSLTSVSRPHNIIWYSFNGNFLEKFLLLGKVPISYSVPNCLQLAFVKFPSKYIFSVSPSAFFWSFHQNMF